jgi:hypothetical protein
MVSSCKWQKVKFNLLGYCHVYNFKDVWRSLLSSPYPQMGSEFKKWQNGGVHIQAGYRRQSWGFLLLKIHQRKNYQHNSNINSEHSQRVQIGPWCNLLTSYSSGVQRYPSWIWCPDLFPESNLLRVWWTSLMRMLDWLTNWLTLWSWPLLERPPVMKPLDSFPAFYRSWTFFTAFTRAFLLSLSWARRIAVHTTDSITKRSILMLSTHLRSAFLVVSFPLAFLPMTYKHFYSLHARNMPRPSHHPRHDNSNYTWRRVQIMQLLVIQFPPPPQPLIPHRSKYYSQNPVLKHTLSIQNFSVSVLCPSSGNKELEHDVSETGPVFARSWREEEAYSVGSVRKS